MNKEHWYTFGKILILLLLSLAAYFAQARIENMEGQQKAMWQIIHNHSERIAKQEGYHEAERCYVKDKAK